MKIAYIIPGSGNNFYCENCIRDLATARAMRNAGHDVMILPMYLPLPTDYAEIDDRAPIFYGAVNLYLKQTIPFFRSLPRWLSHFLDSSFPLKLAAKNAGSTRAAGLDDLTLSMLAGERGNQAAELRQMLQWLKTGNRPDLVHLSNALLLGLASGIRKELHVPVVCSLQDEDTWVDDMESASAAEAWQLMREQAKYVCQFTAVSRYFAGYMQQKLALPADKLTVLYPGIEAAAYHPSSLPFDPPVIGYLSRTSSSLGLGILADAFIRLSQYPGMDNLKLHITGGNTTDDKAFLTSLKKRLQQAHLEKRVSFIESHTQEQRARFLEQITILSVPTPHGAALGLYQLEALACGVPVVQPDLGGFTELIKATGGGITYTTDNPNALSNALHELLSSPQKTRETGNKGREAVLKQFTTEQTASNLTTLYKHCLEKEHDHAAT